MFHIFSSLPDQYNVDVIGVVTFVGRMERIRKSMSNVHCPLLHLPFGKLLLEGLDQLYLRDSDIAYHVIRLCFCFYQHWMVSICRIK